MYLYLAVDSGGNTVDFYLIKNRKAKSAKRFFKKALASCHASKPRVLKVDKNPAYPKAVKQSQKAGDLPEGIKLRQMKYLNNIVEQDHRFIKKRVRYMLGFQAFHTVIKTLAEIEAMHMIRKVHTFHGEQSVQKQIRLINIFFGITA